MSSSTPTPCITSRTKKSSATAIEVALQGYAWRRTILLRDLTDGMAL